MGKSRKKRKSGRTRKEERPIWSKVRLAAAGVLLLSCPICMLLFSHTPEAFFPAYREFSKGLAGVLSWLTSWAPFALWDIGLVAAGIWIVFTLIRRLWKCEKLLPWASWTLLFVAAVTALAVDGWALNHYGPTLAEEMDLPIHEYSEDELAQATGYYLGKAADTASSVPRNDGGSLADQDFYELAKIAGSSYVSLSEQYPVFSGSTEPVKALLLFGEPLLYSGHTGIYWAASGEAGVPTDDAAAELPFTMCHEAAHRLGIASEEDANFAAFLASSTSDDARFVYSGYYDAFAYCLNALYAQDAARAQQVVQEALGENEEGVTLVFSDRAATQEHYAAYEGTFEEVGTSVNNSYLQSFGETAGVKSYGLVVDDLIAWYEKGL
ncbi:MAG: DUF3810 domain-containing protein [Atopobiaceae bacterium]